MDKLIEALKALAEGKGDKVEAAKLFKEHAGAVHQIVFQDGHNVGYGKKAGELTTAQEQVTTLTSENTQLKKDLEQAGEKNPDVAKLHSGYQTQIAELKTAHKVEVEGLKGKLQAKDVAIGKSDLVKELKAQGVDGEYAETVLANRDDVAQRIKVDASSGELQYYQAGGTIPIVAAGDRRPVQLLADELVKGVEAKWINSQAGPGAGIQPGGPGAPAGAPGLIKEIRDAAKAEREAAAGQRQAGPADGIAHMAVTGQ